MNDMKELKYSQLSMMEKLGVSIGRLNEVNFYKSTQYWYCRNIIGYLVKTLLGHRVYVDNIDWISNYNPERGAIFAGNHRTFFDLWLAMDTITKKMSWFKRLSFPVRSNFFYDNIAGILLNFILGAGVMYPPVFRDTTKSNWNRDAIKKLIHYLSKPGSVLGFHPEGTRNKGQDPYTLLPAKPGIGELIMHANPIVIPFFINGLSNSLITNIRQDKKKNARLSPVIAVFGNPINFSSFINMDKETTTYKLIANHVLDEIRALMPREKQIRQACAMEQISMNDSGWFSNAR